MFAGLHLIFRKCRLPLRYVGIHTCIVANMFNTGDIHSLKQLRVPQDVPHTHCLDERYSQNSCFHRSLITMARLTPLLLLAAVVATCNADESATALRRGHADVVEDDAPVQHRELFGWFSLLFLRTFQKQSVSDASATNLELYILTRSRVPSPPCSWRPSRRLLQTSTPHWTSSP